MVRAAAVDTETDSEPDYLDVDVVDEDSGALPVGASIARDAEAEESERAGNCKPTSCHWISARHQKRTSRQDEYEPDGTEDEYEYVADSSGLEAPSDADLQLADSLSAARRRRYEARTAMINARKYKFRKRVLMAMAATAGGLGRGGVHA